MSRHTCTMDLNGVKQWCNLMQQRTFIPSILSGLEKQTGWFDIYYLSSSICCFSWRGAPFLSTNQWSKQSHLMPPRIVFVMNNNHYSTHSSSMSILKQIHVIHVHIHMYIYIYSCFIIISCIFISYLFIHLWQNHG